MESLQRTKTNKHWLHEYSCSACTGFHGLSTRATLTTPPLSWFSTDTFSNVNSLCWMLGTKIKKYTGMSYLISLNPMLFKNIAHVWSSKHFVFVYLRICIFVYLCISHLIHENVIYISDILESHACRQYVKNIVCYRYNLSYLVLLSSRCVTPF